MKSNFCAAAVAGFDSQSKRNRTYLMIVPVKISSGSKTVLTYALCDTGSEKTFCNRAIVNKLKLTGSKISLPVQPFSTESRSDVVNGIQVDLVVSSVNDDFTIDINDVIAVKN